MCRKSKKVEKHCQGGGQFFSSLGRIWKYLGQTIPFNMIYKKIVLALFRGSADWTLPWPILWNFVEITVIEIVRYYTLRTRKSVGSRNTMATGSKDFKMEMELSTTRTGKASKWNSRKTSFTVMDSYSAKTAKKFSRWQFHQHFIISFFIRKCFALLLCADSLCL